jgi:hypothetical protein
MCGGIQTPASGKRFGRNADLTQPRQGALETDTGRPRTRPIRKTHRFHHLLPAAEAERTTIMTNRETSREARDFRLACDEQAASAPADAIGARVGRLVASITEACSYFVSMTLRETGFQLRDPHAKL